MSTIASLVVMITADWTCLVEEGMTTAARGEALDDPLDRITRRLEPSKN